MGLFTDIVGLTRSATGLYKSERVSKDADRGRGPGAAIVADPWLWANAYGEYREKPARASYSVLRYLCRVDTVLAAIVLTRLHQMKMFSRARPHDEASDASRTNTTGFRVNYRKGAGARTRAAIDRESELTKFITNCGRDDIKRREKSFATFLWRFVKDRLEFDQACAEIRSDRQGNVAEFFAVDGGTIRIIDPTKQQDGADYVQVESNRVVARFFDRDLMFCPENISTELRLNGYSISETEILLKKTQSHLGIDEVNARQFHPGAMPKGFLAVDGMEMSEDHLQVLEANWQAQITNGFRSRHRVPVITVPRGGKFQYIKLPQPGDIEHARFLDYLVNTATSLHGMDPAEINFPNRGGGAAGNQVGMLHSSPEALRLTVSKDKGLRGLLAFVEDCINYELMPLLEMSGDFEFNFIGYDRQTDQERADQDDKRSKVYATINEVREAHGLEPRDDGDIIRDSVWLQAKQAAAAQAPQEGQNGDVPWKKDTEPQWEQPEEAQGDLW